MTVKSSITAIAVNDIDAIILAPKDAGQVVFQCGNYFVLIIANCDLYHTAMLAQSAGIG